MVWYGMVEVCEGAPVAVSGWVLTDRHDVRPCAGSNFNSIFYFILLTGNPRASEAEQITFCCVCYDDCTFKLGKKIKNSAVFISWS